MRIRRDNHLFNATVVAVGRFGVIYSLVLKVVPAFRLAEYAVERPTAELVGTLRSGIDAGTVLGPQLVALPDPPATWMPTFHSLRTFWRYPCPRRTQR